MSLLNNLIQTVGLDSSFFFQLALAVALYFVLKKLLFQPYIESFERRQELTKGRMKSSKELEDKIEENKRLYEKKAKLIHEQFQEVFNEIKQETQERCQNEILQLKQEQKEFIGKEKEKLSRALKEETIRLEKELPALTNLLIEKIKA